jgi:hypothetical protein
MRAALRNLHLGAFDMGNIFGVGARAGSMPASLFAAQIFSRLS